MKAFTTKITIGNDSTTEQVFASDTRLAVQRAVYTATRLRHELKTGESFDMTFSCERIPFTKEMKKQVGKTSRTVSGVARECIGVRGHFVPEKYAMIGDILVTTDGRVAGSVMGWDQDGSVRIRTLTIDGVAQPLDGCINFSLRERLKNLGNPTQEWTEGMAQQNETAELRAELDALGL